MFSNPPQAYYYRTQYMKKASNTSEVIITSQASLSPNTRKDGFSTADA